MPVPNIVDQANAARAADSKPHHAQLRLITMPYRCEWSPLIGRLRQV